MKNTTLFQLVLVSRVLFVGLILSGAPLPRSYGASFLVNTTADTDDKTIGDGVCDDGTADPNSPDKISCSLRAAIQEAKSAGGNHTIRFIVEGTINLSGPLPPLESSPRSLPPLKLTITGPGPNALTIRGNQINSIFNIIEAATIRGMTITQGGASAIYNLGKLTLRDCVITANTGQTFGGAIVNYGTLVVTDCTISKNSVRGETDVINGAAEGGAIYNAGTGNVRILNSTLNGNAAFGAPPHTIVGSSHTSGGAISNFNGTVTLINSTISGNVARGGDTGVFLSALGSATATEEDAKKYYDIVDPPFVFYPGDPKGHGIRETLGDWWASNGFDRKNGSPRPSRTDVYLISAAHAAYSNNNDLGFGRDTNILMRRIVYLDGVKTEVNSWLANYSLTPPWPDQNPLSADAAAAREPGRGIAAVCMEYSSSKDASGKPRGKPLVAFFVYDGVGPTAKRVLSADLDGYGKKAVPYLCTTCHGGFLPTNPTRSDVLKMNSSFREFDLASFKFPRPGFPIDHSIRSSPDTPEQREFRRMNDLVLATNPSPAIKELINGWYSNSPEFQNPNFVPPGWEHHPTNPNLDGEVKQLYQQVIATSCRTCHVAGGTLDPKDPHYGLLPDFKTFAPPKKNPENRPGASFQERAGQVPLDVFRYHNGPPFILGNVTMPHAMIAFKNFWKTDRPALLANALVRLTGVFKDNFDGQGVSGSAARGGGIDNENGKVMIAADTIAFNTASGGVGFNVVKNNGQLDMTSSIGMGDAGGAFSEASMPSTSLTTLRSSIISENFDDTDHFTDYIALRPGNLGGPFFSLDFNLIGQSADYTLSGKTTYNLLGRNPMLGLLADNGGPTFTHAMCCNSPALDAGDNQILDLVSTDQRGFSRKMGYYVGTPPGAVDIGAYEYLGTERDITSEVRITRGGFYFNRSTNRYEQQVTIQNITGAIIFGPLRLALEGLPDFVSLANAAGTDSEFYGFPFVSVDIGNDNIFQVGEIPSIPLEFTNPFDKPITYRARVLQVVPRP